MKCVQLLWAIAFLLSHQLSDHRSLVECKVRNRVQKWQQRTWRARFGAGPQRDWKTAFEPPKTHRRSRYGLSPREDDFFSPDAVPNAYSNYHYRRVGNANAIKSLRSAKLTGSGRRRDHGAGKYSLGTRLKRHARGHSAGPAGELKDYLDPVDLMLLGDDPNGEFVPLHPDFSQQYNIDEDLGEMPIPSDSEQASAPVQQESAGGADKQLKEFKIVFHHRNPNGGCIHPRVSVSVLAFLVISALRAAAVGF